MAKPNDLHFGSPANGWPSFCPDCKRRLDRCECEDDLDALIRELDPDVVVP